MNICWSCGTPYPGFVPEKDVEIYSPKSNAPESVENEEIETIKPCELEEMDFCKKLFAYNLLLNGELLLSFCECRKCTDSLSVLLGFVMESEPENEAVKEEIEKIDRSEFKFDTSIFRTG